MDEEPSTDTHDSTALVRDGCAEVRSTHLLAGPKLFEMIAREKGSKLLKLALRITGHVHDAEEVLQDAFISAATAAPRTFNNLRHVECWFVGVVKSRAIDLLRKRARWQALAEPDAGQSASRAVASDLSPDERVELSEFLDGFQALPYRDRQLLWQADVLEHTNPQIAEQLGISVGTATSRLAAARKKLREALEMKRVL